MAILIACIPQQSLKKSVNNKKLFLS